MQLRKPFQDFIQHGKNVILDEMLDWFAPALNNTPNITCVSTIEDKFTVKKGKYPNYEPEVKQRKDKTDTEKRLQNYKLSTLCLNLLYSC